MNTFLDMENTFLSIYKEALLKYPSEKDEDDENDYFEDEIGIDGFLEEAPEILDREVYIIEQIQMLPENEYNDFVSLLALFYYSLFTHDLTDTETVPIFNIESDDYNEIVNDMINQTKNEFLENVKDPNCDYLMDMVEIFIAEEIEDLLTEEEIKRAYIEAIDDLNWEIITDSLQLDFSKEVFEKFHPNLEEESKEYARYKKNEYYLEKLKDAPVSSIKDFFQVFFFAKAKLSSEKHLKSFLSSFVVNQRDKNNEMYQEIILVILKYYYVEKCVKNEEEVDDIAFEIANYIEEIDYNFWEIEEIVRNFSDFDFKKFSDALTKLSPSQSLIFDKVLTLESKKFYGNKGSWRLIDLEAEYDKLKDTFLRYCPSWIYYLDNSMRESKKMYMYSSEDNNKKHTIPRLCLYVDSTGKIEKIEGRFDGNKIEYEMLDVLKEKIKEFTYPKRIRDDINYLTIMANINKKLDQKEELNLNEIEFLYEINEKVDSQYLLRRRYLEEKTDIKKDLARYYGCKAEEVITDVEELDEKTVVYTNSIQTNENECNYPNLRIIMGNLFAESLKSAEGLSSLEEVRGFMSVEDLESSKGLENLIHVGESADFSSMKNTDYLNPDLIVDGSIKLPNKETQKQLQKKFDTVKNNNNSKGEE